MKRNGNELVAPACSDGRILSAMTKRERSILKGAVAGMIGGLAGAGAKILVEKIFPPRTEGQSGFQATPTVALAEQMAGHALPEGQRVVASQGIHWGFGAAAGAIYGAMVEIEPSLGAWKGAAFGLTLNKITHESLLPKMGLSAPKEQQPAQERISEWVSHAVYGIFTDAVRRGVRRAL